ncbi:hypothetical protein PCAR4_260069 [Paraburkholderia caribensis]|nr:hypothetical protein PCAR4_260069 [Paraburkholderia caribensis]
MKSVSPALRSACASTLLTAGCDTHSSSAAFESEPVRMMAWKTSMWRRRMARVRVGRSVERGQAYWLRLCYGTCPGFCSAAPRSVNFPNPASVLALFPTLPNPGRDARQWYRSRLTCITKVLLI